MGWYSHDIFLILISISWYYQSNRISSEWWQYQKNIMIISMVSGMIFSRYFFDININIMILSVLQNITRMARISKKYDNINFHVLSSIIEFGKNIMIISWYYQSFDFLCEVVIIEYLQVNIMRLSWYYQGLTRSLPRNQNLMIISWYYQYFDFSCEGLVVEYLQWISWYYHDTINVWPCPCPEIWISEFQTEYLNKNWLYPDTNFTNT